MTHKSNSNLITHIPNSTITQKLQNCCLVTKTQSHNSTFKSTFCQNGGTHHTDTTQELWLLPASKLPSPLSYSPTSITTINGKLRTHHCQHHQWPPKKKKKSNHQLQPQKEKKFQSSISPPTTQTHFHHSPSFKPQLQTLKTQTHQYKIFRSVIQNCQLKPTNTENPNPNPRILRSKSKIMKMRSGFLFLGIYLCVDEHGEWV